MLGFGEGKGTNWETWPLNFQCHRASVLSADLSTKDSIPVSLDSITLPKSNGIQTGTSDKKSQCGKRPTGKHRKRGNPLALPLEASEYCVPRGNRKKFRDRQPNLYYRWNLMHGFGEPQARGGGENVERFREEVRQLMEKLREMQLSHTSQAISNDIPHHDHHSDFCHRS